MVARVPEASSYSVLLPLHLWLSSSSFITTQLPSADTGRSIRTVSSELLAHTHTGALESSSLHPTTATVCRLGHVHGT
jgi:hypothetical protein